MHSVIIELAKFILVGTRITYQATGDTGHIEYLVLYIIRIYTSYPVLNTRYER